MPDKGRTMKAVVIYEAGGPEVLKIESRPIPEAKEGWVLIKVKAFGLNRSELFTRQGHSPNVGFPRILGIEAVGVVEAAPGAASGSHQVAGRYNTSNLEFILEAPAPHNPSGGLPTET